MLEASRCSVRADNCVFSFFSGHFLIWRVRVHGRRRNWAASELPRGSDVTKRRLWKSQFIEVCSGEYFTHQGIEMLICMMSILMHFLHWRMRLSHVAEDFRKLTLHPILIPVNLLMKTNQKLSICHHSSLSRVLSWGMSYGFNSHSRLRMTNISSEGVGWENFFI